MTKLIRSLLPILGFFTFLLILMLMVSALPVERPVKAAAGNPTFIDGSANLIIDETLRILCYDSPSTLSRADVMVTTGMDGTATLPDPCPYLAAYRLHHTQPSTRTGHGPSFWIYTTSFAPGTTTPIPTTGMIEIDESNTLVLFNVAASFGWDLPPGSAARDELLDGFRQASAYLYDISEGQAAFGPVTIYDDGRQWNQSDFRVMPANDYRPAAYVGGIVQATTPYTGPVESTDFVPANIFLGRQWNGNDARTGPWNASAGYRTLIHEWGHYAHFLYDEYIQTPGLETYCVCDMLPTGCGYSDLDASIMALQYVSSELWAENIHGVPAACTNTHQYFMHGLTDWKTMAEWHRIQNIIFTGPLVIPIEFPPTLTSGPSLGLVEDLFARRPGHAAYLPAVSAGGSAGPAASDAEVSLFLNDTLALTATMPTEVYLLEEAAAGEPLRIAHQGRIVTDPIPATFFYGNASFVGVNENDLMRIYIDQYRTPGSAYGRFTYPHPGEVSDLTPVAGLEVELLLNEWGVSVDLVQQLSDGKFTKLIVDFTSLTHSLEAVSARLCVMDTSLGCAPFWEEAMTQVDVSGNQWQTSFEPEPGQTELPPYGIIYISHPDLGEVIAWYQVDGGVGPGHIHGDAPLRDWAVMVDTENPIPLPDECNQVLVSPARNAEALMTSLGTDAQGVAISGLIGPPLDIDILLPANGGCPTSGGDHVLPVDVILTFFYSQEIVDQLQLSEFNLRLLRFTRGNNSWSEVFTNGQDTNLNWMASVPVVDDGIYAIGYVTFP